MPESYSAFRYYYPPRPENKIKATSLPDFENGSWLGQPKLNGSSVELYINPVEKEVKVFNRHKEPMSVFKITNSEILALNKTSNWMVLCGEYMNKSQKDKNGKVWNEKYVIWDILVYDGVYLTDTTFEERVKLLDSLFGTEDFDEYLYKISENIYRAKSFETKLTTTYNDIVKIGMLEGLVLKRKNGKLERGTREKNNVQIQVKVRKPTKNYEL